MESWCPRKLVAIAFFCAWVANANPDFGVPSTPGAEEEIRAACAEILSYTGNLAGAYSEYQKHLFANYAGDPISRGLLLARRFPRMQVSPIRLRNSRRVSFDTARGFRSVETVPYLEVMAHNEVFSQLRAIPVVEDPGLDTLMLVHQSDTRYRKGDVWRVTGPGRYAQDLVQYEVAAPQFVPRENSAFIAELEHGFTVLDSLAARQIRQINAKGGQRTNGTVMKTLRENGYWIPNITPVARDNAFHGSGSRDPRLMTLEATVAQDMAYDRYLRRHGRLAVTANSGSTLMTLYRNYLYATTLGQAANPIKAQTLVAPVHPVVAFDTMLKTYHEENIEWLKANNASAIANSTLNEMAFGWFIGLREQMLRSRWWQDPHPLGDPPTPTLILVGENDTSQVPHAVRETFRNLAKRYPDRVYYVEIPKAPHDVFSETDEISPGVRRATDDSVARSALAYSYQFWFYQRHMMNNFTLPEPSLARVKFEDR